MSGLRSVADHRAALLAGLEPLPPVTVATPEALGLVLAEVVTSRLDLPGFDNSAMDGYAVRVADLAGFAPEGSGCCGDEDRGAGDSAGPHSAHSITLPVADDIAAGDTRALSLAPGTAARIMTGAPVPQGADAIIRVEDTDGGTETVTVTAGAGPGQHIRRRGEDVRVGAVLLEPGTLLTPGRIALLAAANVARVRVHPRPRVTVLSTGDELLPLGSEPAHGQIIDSNQVMLVSLVEAAGGALAHAGRLADEDASVRAAFTAPPGDPDLVLTTGGVSMGAHDTVKEVLRDLGGVEFTKVAMRPGMPQGGGRLPRARAASGTDAPDDARSSGSGADSAERADGIPIVTLPGNPVSSFVSFHVFVLPVLRRLAGRDVAADTREVVAGATWSSSPGKTEFTRVRVVDGVAHPERGQGSHMLGALAGADGLAIVDGTVREGDPVTVIRCVGEA